MSMKELVDHFIRHSPKFYGDIDLSEIDNKHSNILKEAYLQIKNGEAFSQTNFRNWKEQSDLAPPSQLSLRAMRLQGAVNLLIRYVYKNLFRRDIDRFQLSALLDDIEVIKLLGGKELLIDNPVHLTPGVSAFYNVCGTSVNFRWLRYLYLLKRIIDHKLLAKGGVWVDVGSYYGGLQGLVRKYHPESRLVLVDFHHQLCRSFLYLSHLFPNAKHIMPDQLSEYNSFREMPEGAMMYVPVSEYGCIANQEVDLASNFFSLGEMRREFFESYMNSPLFRESKKVFLVNRVVSAPYFEKTYDSDVSILDYVACERKIEYFDLFPMHHYMLMKRELFGRKAFRNVSSPYFEMLTSKADV